MKVNEIIARQNRVIYILLVVVGALGLVWTIWRHQYLAHAEDAPTAAPVTQPVSGGAGH